MAAEASSLPRTGPPPAAPPGQGPRRPPTAPAASTAGGAPTLPPLEAPEERLSAAATTLATAVAGVANVVSSMELSWRLPDYLMAYWRARQEVLARDAAGALEQDYEAALGRAKALHGAGGPEDEEAALEAIRRLADELDAEKIPYFAPGLTGDELRFLQAAHDLAMALVLYKQATRIASVPDRLVMLTSSVGAMGCLETALNRFDDVAVPEAVEKYARLLTFKIRLEEEKCRGALEG